MPTGNLALLFKVSTHKMGEGQCTGSETMPTHQYVRIHTTVNTTGLGIIVQH